MEKLPRFDTLSEEQKKKLLDLCISLVLSSEKARREGILALEDEVYDFEQEKSLDKYKLFQNILMRMLVDGIDGKNLSLVADNYIASSCDNDFETLAFNIIKTGVINIQEGTNPDIQKEILISMLGLQNATKNTKYIDASVDEAKKNVFERYDGEN